ncbi:c-type cytochrome biogenesis protein CcmI [Psychrosphaera haliotis]|nr:c-type cytochrome biogenesis protein CcmI [Psychrosphaera haliotis]
MTLSISTFWALSVLMIAIACVFVVVPFFKFSQANTYKGLKSNWYRTRLQELNAELEKGQFSQQQYNDALKELKLTATDELREEQNQELNEQQSQELGQQSSQQNAENQEPARLSEDSTKATNIQRYTFTALVLLVITTFTGYWFYGQQEKLVHWEDALERFPALLKEVVENETTTATSEELRDLSLGLRTKLQTDPKAIGWTLLGRNLHILGDVKGAIDAFEKSYNLDPNSIGNMISYAGALQQNGQPGDYSRSIRILKNALTRQPQNLTALILTAEGYMLDEQFERAYTGFELVSRVIDPQDPRALPIQDRLQFLSKELEVADSQQASNASQSTDQNTGQEKGSPADSAELSGPELEIVLNVRIGDNIDLSQFKTLFLFAKKPGMAMPLAVKKLDVEKLNFSRVRTLEANATDGNYSEGSSSESIATDSNTAEVRTFVVSLTDKNVMVPGMSLLGEPQVDIFARLSKDTSAPKELGDLEASVTNLSLPATKPVELLIKK